MKIFFTVVLLFICSSVYAEPLPTPPPHSQYYCKDQASWQGWHTLLEKHPGDDSIYTLYALRLGLCSMIESGNIDKDRAVKIFEKMRAAVIRQYNGGESTDRKKEDGV